MRLTPIIFGTGLLLAACQANPEPLDEVVVMLDWVPNTNHSGLFVAQELGYFDEVGLQVQIIQPGEVFAEQAVVGGAADFGVSFQEQITLARADGQPLVAVAAILQHNSSGFASRGELDTASPADWEGLRYGSFGSPFEQPTLRVLMECDQANFDQLEIVETGFADPLALLDAGQIDLAWIFRGWQGIQAEQRNIDLDMVMMEDWFECIPDYYTPVLIASESTLSLRPALVRAFLAAVSRGYTFAIQDPEAAAAILLRVAPELEPALVQASQAWLSPRYQAEAPRWGEQRLEVWQMYS
ncbi:MAG TPA: ABC transporter substrate-binding protein, partial [Anaerolineales bacterium]|nr:ABC transporter substrate-binding protein [Anaerolineales bacterium]